MDDRRILQELSRHEPLRLLAGVAVGRWSSRSVFDPDARQRWSVVITGIARLVVTSPC